MANFDPTTLFAGGEQGVIYDVQTLSSMFQDSAGTTAAAVNSPVGRINDLSGNGNHAIQTTSASRPMLRYAAGRGYYLESDGVDDYLVKAFTIAQPITRVSLIEQTAWTAPNKIIGGLGVPGKNYGLADNGTLPQIVMVAASAGASTTRWPMTIPSCVTEIYNGASSEIGVNQDVRATGNPGTDSPGGICLFAMFPTFAAHFKAGRFFGTVMINRVLTATEIENAQAWLTQRYTRVVVIDGDSGPASWGLADVSFGTKVIPNASPEVFIQNIAVNGTGLDTNPTDLDTATRRASIDARIPVNKRGRQYVYVAYWTNNGGSDTPDQVATFLAGRKAAGYDKVGICTVVERSDVGQSNVATRGAYNAQITPSWAASKGIDFIVDFASQPTMGAVGASANSTYFESDLVHWKAAGHALLEPIFRAAINGLPPRFSAGWARGVNRLVGSGVAN